MRTKLLVFKSRDDNEFLGAVFFDTEHDGPKAAEEGTRLVQDKLLLDLPELLTLVHMMDGPPGPLPVPDEYKNRLLTVEDIEECAQLMIGYYRRRVQKEMPS